MLAPGGWRGCVAIHFRLVIVGVMKEGQEAIDLGIIFLLSLFNGYLCQVIAKHVLGIYTVHAEKTVIVSTLFASQAIPITQGPFVEPVSVHEMLSQLLVRRTLYR